MNDPRYDPAFRERYGPWAVIAGASDGTGEAFARELAALGFNLMLVARRGGLLGRLADELAAMHGIETRILVQDLTHPDATLAMLKASQDIDVGLYVSNAGALGGGARFYDQPFDHWLPSIAMNVTTLAGALHGFGKRLLERGSGGMIVMATGAALAGRPDLAMYSATKGFEVLLVEGLWAELSGTGVDILGVLAPGMDTPNFRRAVTGDALQKMKAANLIYDPADIARAAMENLPHRPLIMFRSAGSEGVSGDEIVAQRFEKLKKTIA